MLTRGVLESASLEESVELSLIDRVDRSKTHRNGRELPEVRHQSWVRVARQATARLRPGLFLAEVVHFVCRDSAL